MVGDLFLSKENNTLKIGGSYLIIGNKLIHKMHLKQIITKQLFYNNIKNFTSLILAEQKNGKLNKSFYKILTAASKLKDDVI